MTEIGRIELINKYDKKFKLNEFILYKQSQYKAVVQHMNGILQINDEQMMKFIQFCDNYYAKIIYQSMFDKFFKENSLQAIDFLLEHEVIEEIQETPLKIKQVKFSSNHQKVNHFMKDIIEEYTNVNGEIVDLTTMEKGIHTFQGLNIVFLNPYHKRIIKRLRDHLAEDGYLLASYVYNGCFYIDSIYSKKFKTPCHLCHMSFIESEIRKERGVELTYLDLIDSIYSEDIDFLIESPLQTKHIINIIDKISMKLDNLLNRQNDQIYFQKQLKECFKMELSSRSMYVDQSFHWELCDCYE